MNSLYGHIKKVLCDGGIDGDEAKAIALLLLEKVCGFTTAEALMAEVNGVGKDGYVVLEMASRVSRGEPVQYVVGEADFCGLSLCVKPGVLIPRPETQALVEWVSEDAGFVRRVLDVCTGSGCVAIALAKRFPHANVEAWDVSEEALDVAKVNVERCGVEVLLKKVDVLNDRDVLSNVDMLNDGDVLSNVNMLSEREVKSEIKSGYDVIVSNPPYVCEEEASEMEAHVLEHEPRLALFVPDDDPLVFYRQIAKIGMKALRKGGRLYFEINRRFGREVMAMLVSMGYVEVELRQDFCGNDRMVKAIKS